MKKYVCLLFLLPGIIYSLKLNAQTIGDSSGKWSLQDCFQYAATHNIQLNVLRLTEQSYQQDLIQSKALKVPSLSGTVGNTFNNANNINSNTGGLVNQLTSSLAYSVNSSIVLWNDHYISNTIRENELLTHAAKLSVDEAQNNITLSLTQAFLNILLDKENLKYYQDLVTTSDARVKQGQQFFDAGSIAKKDLLQLQAQLASDKYLMIQTQNAISQDILSLKQILQLGTDVFFDVQLPADISVNRNLSNLKDAQQYALNNFPEIKIGTLNIDIASIDIAKAKAGFKPVLKANAALGSGYFDVLTNAYSPKAGYFMQTGNNFYQLAGVTLAIPIFSNRVNEVNLAKANIAYKENVLNQENNQLILSQQVERAYLNSVNALHSYDAANEQLQAAAESYRIVNEQLKIGAISSVDMLVVRNQYVQAVQAFTQAKYTAILQQKIYQFYTGNSITL